MDNEEELDGMKRQLMSFPFISSFALFLFLFLSLPSSSVPLFLKLLMKPEVDDNCLKCNYG